MAHKTLIGGTAYTIKGGKDLIAGTSYSKKQGKALVAGTAQTIAFSKKVKVTITGFGGAAMASVTYNGTEYTSATTFEADAGEKITLTAGAMFGKGTITVEGTSQSSPYQYTLHKDVNIKIAINRQGSTNMSGSVTLTLA